MIRRRAARQSRLFSGLLICLATTLFATACFGGAPPEAKRIPPKVRAVQQELKVWQKTGRNPSAAAAEMEQAKMLIDQKRFADAEAHVDRALAILRDETLPDAPNAGAASPKTGSGASGGAAAYEKVRITAATTSNGLFDPALAYNSDGSVGWLTYTAVDGDQPSNAHYLHTHVAKTTDRGKTWRYANVVNESQRGTAMWKGDRIEGYWHYEVSTMFHDPTDRGREWKMLSFRIFHADKLRRMPQLSWIVYKYASDPAGKWSDEASLLASGMLPPKPYDDQKFKLNDMHRELKGNVVYSEPGAVVVDGTIYLSLTGLTGEGANKIFLLKSSDHLKSLEYVGVLADRDDAKRLGDRALDGSALFLQNGTVYMLACAIHSKSRPDLENNGTYLFAVEDLSRAKLRRDADGKLTVLERILPQDMNSGSHGGGQAGYDAYNTGGGILVPQINLGAKPDWAQVFDTEIVPK